MKDKEWLVNVDPGYLELAELFEQSPKTYTGTLNAE